MSQGTYGLIISLIDRIEVRSKRSPGKMVLVSPGGAVNATSYNNHGKWVCP